MFFIAYAFKVHVFAGRVKIVSHSSCRASAILKYFCPLQFAGKNQDLMDENLILKDQIKQHEAMSADENQKLQRRFVSEMSVCFSELQSLVQICVQRAEGEDPNISLLLGMRGTVCCFILFK